jgi:hypothetical protein
MLQVWESTNNELNNLKLRPLTPWLDEASGVFVYISAKFHSK